MLHGGRRGSNKEQPVYRAVGGGRLIRMRGVFVIRGKHDGMGFVSSAFAVLSNTNNLGLFSNYVGPRRDEHQHEKGEDIRRETRDT